MNTEQSLLWCVLQYTEDCNFCALGDVAKWNISSQIRFTNNHALNIVAHNMWYHRYCLVLPHKWVKQISMNVVVRLQATLPCTKDYLVFGKLFWGQKVCCHCRFVFVRARFKLCLFHAGFACLPGVSRFLLAYLEKLLALIGRVDESTSPSPFWVLDSTEGGSVCKQ